uniref:U-box domain containing 5 n=1 Tax=Vombatus ursinus TaxID=29139 RepID=A0A4X2LPE6_VOMUR
MVINLCLPQFKPRIHCNKISADGYEVENLISEDLVKRNRGFRTEYFIKPPIHVTVSFPFNVELSKINVDLTSGGVQNIVGLEVFTSTSSGKTYWSTMESEPSVLEPTNPEKEVFTLVGRVLLKNQGRATFTHKGFKARAPFHLLGNNLTPNGTVTQDLWSKGPFSLGYVSNLKISITQIAGSGITCIKKVEIWGQPAKSCSQEVIENVMQLASQNPPRGLNLTASHPNPTLPMENDNESRGQGQRPPGPQELADALDDVPEEFLDPITLEIMSFPMLLPSGKVIDQSTLERCNRSEAVWGRVPSDPFTGVAFTPNSQPQPHAALKVRIDCFLLQNTVPGCNVVGRAQAPGVAVPSSIAAASRKRKGEFVAPLPNPPDLPRVQPPPYFFTTDPRFTSSTSENNTKKMKLNAEPSLTHMECSSAGTTSHEQRLSESLDVALTSALSTLPSFTGRLTKAQPQHLNSGSPSSSSSWSSSISSALPWSTSGPGCSTCSRVFTTFFRSEPAYQLPCGHLICRICLAERQKSPSVHCVSCKKAAANQDVLRVHL